MINLRLVLICLPIYVVLMTAINTLLKSLKLDEPGLPLWVIVGFFVAAMISFLVVAILVRKRMKDGPFGEDKQRFVIAILLAVVAANVVESILYAAFAVTSVIAAVPIEILSYVGAVGTALIVMNSNSPQPRHK